MEREFAPVVKELIIRPETPSQPEKRISVPAGLHPALAEAYIVKAAYKSMEGQKTEIWNEMANVIEEQRQRGYNDALKFVLATCAIPIPYFAEDLGSELSADSKRLLTGILTGEPPKATVPPSWTPPAYDEADDYVDQMCRDDVDVVIGNLDGEEVRCGMDGQVECFDMLHCSGEALLRFQTELGETSIKVLVLGALCGRGVAMLLDQVGNVWLYHVPNAVDRSLQNLRCRLALVLKNGEEGYVDKKLILHETYDDVKLDLVDPYLTREEILSWQK